METFGTIHLLLFYFMAKFASRMTKSTKRKKLTSTSRSANAKSNSCERTDITPVGSENQDVSCEILRQRVEKEHSSLSIARQCALLGLSRSGYYCEPTGESELNLLLLRLLDAQYTTHPFYGVRKMAIFAQPLTALTKYLKNHSKPS